ncbi:uncharacterized protein LOC141594871 [Silene latifolia]|uniref:uncharacterized protein LOC141594871 n=1 Tax=Silene latifolia TaxID=37657 RepID=UPI003D788231
MEKVSVMPIWILFPDLDPYLWSSAVLSKMSSKIGRPMFADIPTTNKEKLSFARVMIEVDIAGHLPLEISLNTPFGPSTQRVEYEWIPHYCQGCEKMGHMLKTCKKKQPQELKKSLLSKSGQQQDPPCMLGGTPATSVVIPDSVVTKVGSAGSEPIPQVTSDSVSLSEQVGMHSECSKKGTLCSPQIALKRGVTILLVPQFTSENAFASLATLEEGELDASHTLHSLANSGSKSVQSAPQQQNVSPCLLGDTPASSGVIFDSIVPAGSSAQALESSSLPDSAGVHSRCSKKGQLCTPQIALKRGATTEPTVVPMIVPHSLATQEVDEHAASQLLATQVPVDTIPTSQEGVLVDRGKPVTVLGDGNPPDKVEDLPSSGCEMSWTNKQETGTRVWSKLDRALGNPSWMNQFPATSANFLASRVSDHSPIVVTVLQDHKRPSAFSFLNCWIEDPSYDTIVQEAWHQPVSGSNTFKFFEQLKNVRKALKSLHGKTYNGITTKTDVLPLDTSFLQQGNCVLPTHMKALTKPVTREEIRQALFDMDPDKSPGPDGFSSAFFKHSWALIGDAFCKAVNAFFVSGRMSKQVQVAVQHWSSKLLSYAGKVQLLSSVVFGLENFWCSSGLLPKSIIKLMDQMCKKNFWGIGLSHRKLVPKSWKSICSPREEGGFGIKELLSWNKALVSKWVWKLTLPPNGIWCNWNTTYPLHNGTIWDISARDYFSESLNSIIAVKNELIHATGSQAAAQTLLHSWCTNGQFHTHLAYNWFRPKFAVNTMLRLPFGKAVEPKKAIIASLALQKRLTTALWGGMLAWMKISGRSNCYIAEFKWCAGKKTKKHWKHTWFVSCLVGTLYAI